MARLCVLCLSALSVLAAAAQAETEFGSAPGITTAQCPVYLPGNLNNLQPQHCPLPGHLGIIPDLPSTIWSHPPQCIPPSANSTGLDCLFVSSSFRSHGLALLTSTTTASNLVGSDALSDRPAPPAALKRDAVGKAYRIVNIPENNKGRGVVATRRVRRGEILMVDTPVVLVSVPFLAGSKPHHRRRWMRKALNMLPRGTREEVEGLGTPGGKGHGHEVERIFGTNTNTVVLGGDGEGKGGEAHVGIWKGLARVNHSCRPNAYYRFSEKRLTMEVVAYRTIEPGEEVVLSYTPLAMKHAPRRKYLSDNWNFDCACSLCRGNEIEISESEGRRRQMNDLRSTMLDARSNGYYKDAIAIAGDWKDFSEWEDLPLLMPEYHDVLADLYLLKGDLANATRYARMAADEWVRFGSVDDTRVEAASGMLKKLYELELQQQQGK